MATATAKPKTDRKMIGWIFAIGMVVLVGYLLISKGSDLGQGEMNASREVQVKKAEADRYSAKIEDPAQATRAAIERAEMEVKSKKQGQASANAAPVVAPPTPPSVPNSVDALAPPPPVGASTEASDMNLSQLERARKAAESTPGAQDSSMPSAGFVVYQAGPLKKDGNFSVMNSLAADGRKSEAKSAQPETGEVKPSDPNENPEVKAAQANVDAYKAQMAAQHAAQADKAEPGMEGNDKWLYDRQNSKVEAAESLVAKQSKGLYWLSAGSTINAVILNAIDTRLPGNITARVTQSAYDSRYGRYLVIPAGSVLVGSYNSAVADGQKRVMLAFDRMITPSGGEVDLGSMSAGDGQGRSGVGGKLHTHFAARMGIATVLALEAVEMDRLSKQTQVVAGTGLSGPPPVSSGGQIIVNAGNEELKRRFATGPNITLEAGAPMTIVTTSGIEIPPIANAR